MHGLLWVVGGLSLTEGKACQPKREVAVAPKMGPKKYILHI